MIVDCHVNIFEAQHVLPGVGEERVKMRADAFEWKADADTIHAAMSEVDRAILFTLRYGDSAGVEGDDEVTAAAIAKYPEKFVGFAYVDPRRPDYLELLRHAVEDLGLKGVKFGPIYNRVAVDDPRLTPVYEYLVERDIPITMHMGTTYIADCPMDMGRPIHVERVALRFPDLKMVLAHMGHPWQDECIVLIRKQPNVYAEISGLYHRPWGFYTMLVTAQEYQVTDQIFFGTDFPIFGVAETMAGLRNVNDVAGESGLPRISEETVERILHSNPFEHWWHENPLG